MKTRAPWARWDPATGRPGQTDMQGSARKITLHTTEGNGLPPWGTGSGEISGVPHLTVNPATGHAWQHIDLDRGGYALATGAHSPNREAGSIHVQIEIIGYAAKTPGYSKAWYAQLDEWLTWLVVELDIPPVFPWAFTGEDGYGTGGAVRKNWDVYSRASGIVGHSHATYNGHWDPGDLNTDRLTLGADMATSKELMQDHEWSKSGEDPQQSLQQHITQLRRESENTARRVKELTEQPSRSSVSATTAYPLITLGTAVGYLLGRGV